jgi:hypothetical protein
MLRGRLEEWFYSLMLDGVGGQRQAPATLHPGKRSGTHFRESFN